MEPREFERKPDRVMAIRFEKPYHRVQAFCPDIAFMKSGMTGTKVAFALIPTDGRPIRVDFGDWILQDRDGGYSVLTHTDFTESFGAV